MDDIVERLRDRAYCTYRKDALCEEAADLIEQTGRTRDPGDIVAAARAHIASLPPHLKDRYSAKLICKLIAKVLLLEELREQDGAVIGLQLREYQKMKDRCVNGDTLTAEDTPDTHATPTDGSVQNRCTLTAEEREAVEWAAIRSDADAQMIGGEFYAAGQSMRARSANLRKLLERMR
jgi:hypothetical protein